MEEDTNIAAKNLDGYIFISYTLSQKVVQRSQPYFYGLAKFLSDSNIFKYRKN